VPIDQVGVSDLCYPIIVLNRQQEEQQTVAQITMSVSLLHNFKGTHMSRFIEVFNEHHGEMTMRNAAHYAAQVEGKAADSNPATSFR